MLRRRRLDVQSKGASMTKRKSWLTASVNRSAVVGAVFAATNVCFLHGWSLFVLAAASLSGGVMFTDNTFNVSDYSIATWKSDPTIGITVQQTQTGGNPGQALQILYTLPATSGNSMIALARSSFT